MKAKMRLILPPILILVLILSCAGGWLWYDRNVDRSGWAEKEGVRFYQDFHARPVTGWQDLADGHYYFQEGGIPVTGWQTIDGTTYYFEESGILHTGWLRQDGSVHYFGSNGVLVEGWLWLDTDRYYLQDGALLTGWQTIDGESYYFDSDGIAALGFAEIDGQTYYFDNGILTTGFASIDERTYYFREDGTMVTGWEELEDGLHYFLSDGPMARGWEELEDGRYYFQEDTGVLYTGWLELGEYRYYLQEDGTAATGPTLIDGQTHYFSPKGIEVILVNGLNPVPSYFQRDLVNVVDYHDVDSRCYDALVQMLSDCNAAGIEYTFNSAYRTLAEQTAILEYRTREHMKTYDLEFEEARDKAYETVAVPGTSEHHLGLAVDLLGDEAIAWFQEHCWDYGFIVRYTEEKESITGIVDEPWHFRYVGTEVSLDIKDTGLCLEEYLGAEAVTFEKIKQLYGDQLYEETVYQEPTETTPTTQP